MSARVDRLLLDRIGAALAPGSRILDLPTGDGEFAAALASAGYRVTPADRFPASYRAEGRPVCADMNLPLPFGDASLDGVVCQEGIEHLEHPAAFVRECARVLRKGGRLFLTTPNFMDLSSRLAFFLTGMKSFRAGFPNEETTVWGRDGDALYHGHAFTLPYFQIRYLLRIGGFEAVRVAGAGRSTTSAWLYPLVRPLSGWWIARAWRRRAHSKRNDRASPALQGELTAQALDRELLTSKKILVEATREVSGP